MDDLLSEKEQIEQLRSFWSEYGAYIIGGIVIGAGLLFGINYYQNAKLEAQLAASAAFEELALQVTDGDLEAAEMTANAIATDYADTAYAGQAGLAIARLYMDKNRDRDAADALQAVLDGTSGDELKHVARLRLARIFLYQEKAQEVVDMLADIDAGEFAMAYGEVLGDAYAALGRVAEAEDEYQKILMQASAQSRGSVDPELVEWKILDLPPVSVAGAGTEPDVSTAVEETDPEPEVTE